VKQVHLRDAESKTGSQYNGFSLFFFSLFRGGGDLFYKN
jgi:hypothetical protein